MIEHDVAMMKTRIARLERTVEFLLRHVGAQYTDVAVPNGPPEVVALVREGKKIEAIKRYCAIAGVDLPTAKAFVESIE